jgi:hypothetical protein
MRLKGGCEAKGKLPSKFLTGLAPGSEWQRVRWRAVWLSWSIPAKVKIPR